MPQQQRPVVNVTSDRQHIRRGTDRAEKPRLVRKSF